MTSKNDENVIKTKIDVLFRLNISKMICGTYANVSEIFRYRLAAVINFEGSSTTRGHFTAHIFDFNDNTVAKINDGKVSNHTINQVLNTSSFKSSIHSTEKFNY